MKYILINIRNFAVRETQVFLLTIICICSAAVIANFAFGFYHHIEQKKEDEKNGVDYFYVHVREDAKGSVTKGTIMEVLLGLDERATDGLLIDAVGRLEEDRTDDKTLDILLGLVATFSIDNGRVTTVPDIGRYYGDNYMLDGNYFTPEQYENGEYVCIGNTMFSDQVDDTEMGKWVQKYSPNKDGEYVVDGKTYRCIGHARYGSILPQVPVTTLDDGCFIRELCFLSDTVITRYAYNEIAEAFRGRFGDMVSVDELEIKQLDGQRFYNLLIVLTLAIGLLAGVVVALLYEYILLKRKKTLTIFRLCGMTKGKSVFMYFAECMMVTVFSYLAAVLLYHSIVLPYLSKSFEYMAQSYSFRVYFLIGAVYVSIILTLLFFMIRKSAKKEIVSELKGV